MTDNVENPTGASSGTADDQQDPSTQDDPGAYRPEEDTDADPEVMNPRDLRGEGSHEEDPDLDPDGLNPRGEA